MNEIAGPGNSAGQKKVVRIQYEDLSAKYAEQFLVNRSEESFILGFSSGVMDDGSTESLLLPVHSRVAMSEASVNKLIGVLQGALKQNVSGVNAGARVPRVDDAVQ